jgi:hypothetical protein
VRLGLVMMINNWMKCREGKCWCGLSTLLMPLSVCVCVETNGTRMTKPVTHFLVEEARPKILHWMFSCSFCSDLQGTPYSPMVHCSLLAVLMITVISHPKLRACGDASERC